MKLSDLLKETAVKSVQGTLERTIRSLQYDSRRVEANDLFFAWKGEKTDGHDYIAQARERGAAAVVLENLDYIASGGLTLVEVSQARRALATVAATFYHHPDRSLKMAGITGTNGKTTTSFILKHLLAPDCSPVGLIGTVRNEIGERILPAIRTTPESLDLYELLAQMRAANCRAAVMEVTSHALEQGRTGAVQYQVGIFTNLTRDHLDYHHTMEEYFAAKALLFANLDRAENPGVAVLNLDDPYGRDLQTKVASGVKQINYSVLNHPQAEVATRELTFTATGTQGLLRIGQVTAPFQLPLIGDFNVANLLAAIGGALALGVKAETIRAQLATIPQVPGRLEKFASADQVTAVIDYAHTDDAVRKVLAVLRKITPPGNRLIVVLGCGGNRDVTKRPLMARAAVEAADFAVFTADNPRHEAVDKILQDMTQDADVAAQAQKWESIPDRRQAIAHALAMAQRGDIVCLAGKGHETTQEIAGQYHPFDDRIVAQEFLHRRRAL